MGTATTKDVSSIKNRVNQLIAMQHKQQETLVHIVSVLYVTRYATQVNRQYVTGTEKGSEKRRQGLDGIFGMDAGRYADELWQFFCTCTVVLTTEILEQMIVTSLYDVMRVSHATVGGNYKRRA